MIRLQIVREQELEEWKTGCDNSCGVLQVRGLYQLNQMKERLESTVDTSVTSAFYSALLSGSKDLQVAVMPDWTDIHGSGRKHNRNSQS